MSKKIQVLRLTLIIYVGLSFCSYGLSVYNSVFKITSVLWFSFDNHLCDLLVKMSVIYQYVPVHEYNRPLCDSIFDN